MNMEEDRCAYSLDQEQEEEKEEEEEKEKEEMKKEAAQTDLYRQLGRETEGQSL